MPTTKAKPRRPARRNPRVAANDPALLQPFDAERTVAEQLLLLTRTGLPLDRASEYVGLSPDTVKGWIREGAALTRLGKEPATKHQAAIQAFARDVATAKAILQAKWVTALDQAGKVRELRSRKTVTKRDPAGDIVERVITETISETPINATALMFLLERRFPQDWAPPSKLEVTGADGGPIALQDGDVVSGLLRDIERIGERQARSAKALADAGVDLPPDE